MIVNYSYMSGAGNLFTVIDNRNYNFDTNKASKLAPVLCSINDYNPINTEGLILIQPGESNSSDFEADFYNPDGSNDAMCGNGARCAVLFAVQNHISSKEKKCFSMANSLYEYNFSGDDISIKFPKPNEIILQKTIEIENIKYTGSYIDVGSRHFVLNYEELPNILGSFFDLDLNDLCPKIRFAQEFAPNGVNVNLFYNSGKMIFLRTYERGVEAETGACGTGAVSTAIALNYLYEIKLPIRLFPTSGSCLQVDLIKEENHIESIKLKGKAEVLKEIEVNLPDNFFDN